MCVCVALPPAELWWLIVSWYLGWQLQTRSTGEKSDRKLPPNNNEAHLPPLPTAPHTSLNHTHSSHTVYSNRLSITLQHTRAVLWDEFVQRQIESGWVSECWRNRSIENWTHCLTQQPVTLSARCCSPVLISNSLLAACDLIGYSCHAAEAYHIILSDVHFHPIRFPFVLYGCSDANLFNRAHFHFPL